uniref:TRIM8/14/16/25/29/45/65 coiled-coil region domain-containing protein n=1 Tax=Knipowitschia caucasica TaxID=637954 RepID=A0AAV2JXL4_KNICA
MIHERIQERQKQLDLLQCQAGTVICCANTAVDETDTVFTLISRLLERTKAQAKEHIRSQQEAEEHRLKELQNKVQEDITTLKTKCYKLEKLSQCEDLGSILIFPSLSEVEEAPELSISEATPPTFIDLVVNAVADFRDKLQNTDALSRAADEEDPKLSAVAWTTPPQMNEQEQAMQAYQQQLQAMAAETWLNLQNSSLYISGRPSNTIGIYVDVEAGVVCFYSVGREVALIHTINTRFTRPQLAAIWLKEAADCAEICNITPH